MSTLLQREAHSHTNTHISVQEGMVECSEPDLFLSSSRAGNALTYFVCISAIILTALAGRTMCMCEFVFVWMLWEGKRFYHVMNFAYDTVCFAMLARLAWVFFEDLDV